MGTPETIKSGDNVKVESCERNKNTPFCLVSTAMTSRQERKDNGIPLIGPTCGCIRPPEQVEKISSKLP